MMWRIGAAVAVALLASACLNKADAKKTDDAMTAFFAQVRAKQYGAIYDAASPQFHAAGTRDNFIGFMERVDRKLGPCQPPVKRMDWHFNATGGAFFATQGFTSTCANGKLQQQVTIVLRGGQAQLNGYSASNPLLMVD